MTSSHKWLNSGSIYNYRSHMTIKQRAQKTLQTAADYLPLAFDWQQSSQCSKFFKIFFLFEDSRLPWPDLGIQIAQWASFVCLTWWMYKVQNRLCFIGDVKPCAVHCKYIFSCGIGENQILSSCTTEMRSKQKTSCVFDPMWMSERNVLSVGRASWTLHCMSHVWLNNTS